MPAMRQAGLRLGPGCSCCRGVVGHRGSCAALSNSLRNHVDGTARALLDADAATFAEVVVNLVAQRRTEFDDRVVRAHAEAVVALEAVAAREAAAGLEERVLLGQSPDDLVEGRLRGGPARARGAWSEGRRSSTRCSRGRTWRARAGGLRPAPAAQQCVDAAGGPLAVPDGHRDGPLRWHCVAAGEDAVLAGHHRGEHLDDAVLDLNAGCAGRGATDRCPDRAPARGSRRRALRAHRSAAGNPSSSSAIFSSTSRPPSTAHCGEPRTITPSSSASSPRSRGPASARGTSVDDDGVGRRRGVAPSGRRRARCPLRRRRRRGGRAAALAAVHAAQQRDGVEDAAASPAGM